MSNSTVVSLSFLLRKCVPLSAINPAKQIHAQILGNGFIPDITLQTDLLLVYSKCGFLKHARHLFDKMSQRNMHSWNILMASYVRDSMFYEGLSLFDGFMKMGFRPDHFTFPPVFKACGEIGDWLLGLKVHNWVIRLGFEDYVVVGSSILEFYVKFGGLIDAKRVFVGMYWKDNVVWNSMISGFGKFGLFVDALNCFREMLRDGVKMDLMTVSSILNTCGREGGLMNGKEIHGQVVKTQMFYRDVVIGNSLIDMYGKCGCLIYSENIFNNMCQTNVVTWTTMISCYGLHGKGEDALVFFRKMRNFGIKPNCVTLTSILASCSHAGLIDQGLQIFNSISLDYGFEPSAEHYACIVDLLGRFGYLKEALGLIKDMKIKVTASVWGALLSGCVMHKNIEIGEIAYSCLVELEPSNTSNYAALCSIYDSVGMPDRVLRIRAKMRRLGLVKTPGCSWLTIAGRVQKFYKGDLTHPLDNMVFVTLDGIRKASMLFEDFG